MLNISSTHLEPGHEFTIDGNRYFVTEVQAKQKKVTVKNAVTGTQQFFDSDVLLRSVANGAGVVHRDSNGHTPGDVIGLFTDPRISQMARQKRDFRIKIVESVQAEIAKGKTCAEAQLEAYEQFASEGKEIGNKLSVRTVRRYCETAQRFGFQAIVPKDYLKGRKQTPLSAAKAELITEVIKENREKARLTIRGLHDQVNLTIQKRGLALGTVTYQNVRDVLIGMPWSSRHASKFEPKLRRAIISFGSDSYNVRYPFERVEMDFCKLKLYALYGKKRTPVEVWVGVAIDVATGHILAAVVFMRPPNAADALETYRKACLGLTTEEFDAAKIQNRFSVCAHLPTVVVDNGSEFRGVIFTQLKDLGVDVQYLPAYSPYRKPFVERAVGAIKSFTANLPGSTVNQADKSKPDVERGKREAAISVEKLQSLINGFIFDDYALRPMERHQLQAILLDDTYGLCPSDRMKNLLNEVIPCPPPTEQAFRLARMIEHSSSLQRYGIQHETLHYSSSALKSLYHEIGISTKSLVYPDKLRYFVDPLDIRTIHVVHPVSGERIEAHLKVEIAHAMTIDQFKEARAYAKEKFHSEAGAAITKAFRLMTSQQMGELEAAHAKPSTKTVRPSARKVAQAKTSLEQPALKTEDISATEILPSNVGYSEAPMTSPSGDAMTVVVSGLTAVVRKKRGAK